MLTGHKISKFGATRGFKAKMHQIQFPPGLCPRPCWGAYSTPQTPLLNLRDLHLRGRSGWDRKGRRREKGREEEGRAGKAGRIREGRGGEGICRTNVKLLPKILRAYH